MNSETSGLDEMNDDCSVNICCSICGSKSVARVRSTSVFFPSHSGSTILPDHKNYACNRCGVVQVLPQPDAATLGALYNSSYRATRFAISMPDDSVIDLPIQFPESAYSFSRFRNFIPCYDLIEGGLNEKSFVVDLGGYQGMFLYAMRKAYGVEGCVLDFSESGVKHAREAFGFHESKTIDNRLDLKLSRKANLVTMIHSFEHMTDPVGVLRKIGSEILMENGFIFVEVPNLHGAPLCDPTHMFMYSKDSLRYVLELGGFEVIKSYESASEATDFGLSNSEVVVGCLAKKRCRSKDDIIMPRVETSKDINKKYRSHSRKVLIGELRSIIYRTFRLTYFVFVEYVIALLPGHLDSKMKWLKSRINFRF